MKRRNAECGKLRRPLKRSKITENLYSSTFLYVRFLMVWVIVLLGDFFLEFRFEYLWPAWLLNRSLYDSYRYQGLAFCVFFMCVALTSDVVCLLFMPAQWLFFVASTYVWVQLVWQTERGVCLPTVCLWLLFIYIEASVRLREFQKNMPFHLDLCRPFAAHCIGYPVVTLGFGVKSYVSYKVRQRRQKDVERENEFYVQLLQGALPPEMQQHLQQQRELDPELLTQSVMSEHGFVQRFEEAPPPPTSVPASNGVANGVAGHHHHHNHHNHHHNATSRSSSKRGAHKVGTAGGSVGDTPNNSSRAELEFMEQQRRSSGGWKLGTSVNHFDENEPEREKTCSKTGIAGRSRSSSSGRSTSATAGVGPSSFTSSSVSSSSSSSSGGVTASTTTTGTNTTTEPNNNQQHSSKKNRHRDAQTTISKDDVNYQLYVQRLECDVKRLKAELSSIKGNESDLCGKLQTATAAEKGVRMELDQLQADNESLQTRLQGLVSQRQQDKQAVAQLERRLNDEKKSKQALESQLAAERKAAANKERQQKKEQEEQQAQARAQARASCGDQCKQKLRDMDAELKQLRNELKSGEERRRQMERELQNTRRVEEILEEKDRLVATLSKMHQQHAHLEDSLSAETKLKLELFSALGDAKRQLAAKHNMLLAREREIDDLKSKVAEVLAVMPHTTHQHHNLTFGSPLDPNARIYSPGAGGGMGSVQMPSGLQVQQHQIQIPVSAAHSAILEALSDGHGQ